MYLPCCSCLPCCGQQPTEPTQGGQSLVISQQPSGTTTPSVPRAKIDQQPQIPPIPKSLPSQADDTFAACPKFRIVLIGNSGVGKSSLIQNIFNIDAKNIDIAHDRAGEANIELEYESPENPRLILHDSKGFEAGSKDSWATVEKFLKGRHAKELPEKIHAIWFCIETPRPGMRLLEKGDEKLLLLAKDLNIPIIAVFTKYDLLINNFKARQEDTSEKTPVSEALEYFENSARELARQSQSQIPCVRIINKGSGAQETFRNLTNVTHDTLRVLLDPRVEAQQVYAHQQVDVHQQVDAQLWVAAQQVDAPLKVVLTISEGFKKYWLGLARSTPFDGHTLITCVQRIHDDVLKAWNFNDPNKILSRTDFFTEMIALVKPLIDAHLKQSQQPAAVDFGAEDTRPLRSLLNKYEFSPSAIGYLYSQYQPLNSTAKFLATYIVNLILVMHRVFASVLLSGPPTALSDVLVFKVLADHRIDLQKEPLEKIKSVADAATNPDEFIRSVISKRLGFDKAEEDK